MYQKLLRKCLSVIGVTAISLVAALGTANAVTLSGNFDLNGYGEADFTLSAPGTFNVTTDFVEPSLSLFDSSGRHLITNAFKIWDPTVNPVLRITQNLDAGAYSVIVGYCCVVTTYVGAINGARFSDTDGFNTSKYWLGGTGTLAGLREFFKESSDIPFTAYRPFTVTVAATSIPEPGILTLLGLALFGLSRALRRRPSA